MNIFDWFNDMSAQALTAVQSVFSVIVLIAAGMLSGRGGWTISKIVMAFVGAGIVLFFVWGGHLWVRDMFQATVGG